jgi:glycerol-3-phosphate O-acyltransferase
MRMDAPIFGFNDARENIVRTVVERVVESTKDTLLTLNDACYHEIKRLTPSRKPKDVERLAEWQRLARSLSKMSEAERRERVRAQATEYGWDVAGNFNPKVYDVSSRLLPPLVTALLQPRKLATLVRTPSQLVSLDTLAERVRVEGPFEKLRKVAELGTCVFVPTHLSNMDSIVFGYALERAGLPPATYGAGKNLFTNPVLSFFMHNLGAYRVDRRLGTRSTRTCSRPTPCVLLERGYHSLFFPGGTRSRSGGVERKAQARADGHGVRRVRAHADRTSARAASSSCPRRSTTSSRSRPRR